MTEPIESPEMCDEGGTVHGHVHEDGRCCHCGTRGLLGEAQRAWIRAHMPPPDMPSGDLHFADAPAEADLERIRERLKAAVAANPRLFSRVPMLPPEYEPHDLDYPGDLDRPKRFIALDERSFTEGEPR